MSTRNVFGLVAAVALASACHIGPQIAEMPSLRLPQGANVEIEVRHDDDRRFRYEGELIDVREAGFLLELTREESRSLVLVPWNAVERLDATELDGFFTRSADRPDQRNDIAARFRLISRYPQGLSAELLSRLLASYDQDETRSLADYQE